MESDLSYILVENVFVFAMLFARFGTAISIMPGFGDFFTPVQVRLYLALGLCLALTPVFYPIFPEMPSSSVALAQAVMYEFIIGGMIGMMARIFMSALDTGGMIISVQTGLGNAQIFNPGAQTQGSLVGTFFYLLGVVLIFATNLHHIMLYALYESYQMMPPLVAPPFDLLSDLMAKAISHSFLIGFKIGIPFMVIGLVLYVAMGVMGRLMPQVQIFILALPLQILVGFILLSLIISPIMVYWIRTFEQGMTLFLGL